MTRGTTPGGLRWRVVRPPSVADDLDEWIREHAPGYEGGSTGRDPREAYTETQPETEDDDRD